MSIPQAKILPRGGFQSDEAAKAAAQSVAAVNAPEGTGEVVSGEITDGLPQAVGTPVREHDDEMRLVKVRSRVGIEPFRYGKKLYVIAKGKETLIPLCVRSHLEEKNLL